MIIAEISQNFSSIEEAKTLCSLARDSGADLVKAQLFDSMKLYGGHTPSELTFEQARELFEHGKEIGIEVFFSVFDVERIRWCEDIGVRHYKIACDKITDELFHAIPRDKSLIVSYSPEWTGERNGIGLYCIPRYPAWVSDYRFNEIDFGHSYDGISDHTTGIDVAKIALARGAQVIEKHFCFSHGYGLDAQWSMTSDELKELKRWEGICQEIT